METQDLVKLIKDYYAWAKINPVTNACYTFVRQTNGKGEGHDSLIGFATWLGAQKTPETTDDLYLFQNSFGEWLEKHGVTLVGSESPFVSTIDLNVLKPAILRLADNWSDLFNEEAD